MIRDILFDHLLFCVCFHRVLHFLLFLVSILVFLQDLPLSWVCENWSSFLLWELWRVWQYGLWSLQTRGTKLERFLPKNQHTQRNYWILRIGLMGRCQKVPNLTFKVIFCYWHFLITSIFKSLFFSKMMPNFRQLATKAELQQEGIFSSSIYLPETSYY